MPKIEESDRCVKCGELRELVERAAVHPWTGKKDDRYKCECGYTRVRLPTQM